jgi:hypothetical protein
MAKEASLTLRHDTWFRARVQEALTDALPGIPQDVVMDETRGIIDRSRKAGYANPAPKGALKTRRLRHG